MKNVDSWFYFAVTMFQEDVMKSTEFLKSLDVKLILILLALCVTSIAAIYSSSQQTGQYGESNFCNETGFELHNWGCIVIACCKH